jgi:phage terminase large subunit GpA-like protein
MLAAGEWRPMDHGQETGECAYCRERMGHEGPHVPKDAGTASYHLSALYSPWEPWAEIVRLFLAARGDPERLKQWTNTRLAETWKDTGGDSFDYDPLLLRRETYQAQVPPGVVVLTAGVDSQTDRLECEIVGWGAGEESWSIDYFVLPGDPNLPDVWAKLDEVLFAGYTRADGSTLRVAATCLDTGGTGTQTSSAYDYVRRYARTLHRVWGVKGRSADVRDKIWPKQPSVRRTKSGQAVHLYNIREDVAKDVVYARLGLSEEGPGYCHFPMREPYGRAYFKGLTAEVKRPFMKQGRTLHKWELPAHRRNEPLDCRKMAYAALEGLKENRLVDLAVKSGPVTKSAPAKAVHTPARSPSRPNLFGGRAAGGRRSLF